MKGWTTISRRPTLNVNVVNEPAWKRGQSIQNWLLVNPGKWTLGDKELIASIVKQLSWTTSGKQLSENFYTELYKHKAVYKKFVYLSRSIPTFSIALQQSQHPTL